MAVIEVLPVGDALVLMQQAVRSGDVDKVSMVMLAARFGFVPPLSC